MDRTYWLEHGKFLPGEKVISQQPGLRIYEGEDRVGGTGGKVHVFECIMPL